MPKKKKRGNNWGKKKAPGHAHGRFDPAAAALARAQQELAHAAVRDRAAAALEFERERQTAQRRHQQQQQLIHQQQQQILGLVQQQQDQLTQFQQQQQQIQTDATANALAAAHDQIQAATDRVEASDTLSTQLQVLLDRWMSFADRLRFDATAAGLTPMTWQYWRNNFMPPDQQP